MNIIIKTGFEKIKHSIEFQPETMPKGKKLVEANHVYDVEERREHGHSFFIRAQVIRQTSVSSKPYKVQLNINDNREVTSVTCNCVYNKSSKCKHIAALIYYINNEDSLSKTDVEQQWGKPTSHQVAKEKYSKGKYFCEMFLCPEKKRKTELCPLDVSNLKDVSVLQAMTIESTKDETEYSVQAVMSSLLDDVEVLLEKEDCEICMDNLFIFVEENRTYTCNFILKNALLEKFYNENIVMAKQGIIKLCCDTLGQSKCKDWYSARQCRISASSNCHKIKSRKKKSIDSLVKDMLSPKIINTPSLRYGIKNESRARQYYKELFNCYIIEVGVIVCEQQPWLCGSPDGVVVEDGCITKLIEIKCPITCSNQAVVDFEKQQCNIKYLKFQNDEIVLKSSVPYYTQVQVQMYLTGLSICDLFIYSFVENGSFCVQVYRDEQFLEKTILSCEQFYFENFLPALYATSLKQNSVIKSEGLNRQFTGKNICNQIL